MSNIKRTLLTGETSVVIDGQGIEYPASVTLKSSNATRKIELSTDDGLEYFIPQIDITTATMLVVVLNGPITNIRITGVVNDVFTAEY
jgi:hypothetical protein